MKKILVIGGSGFIGGAVIEALHDKGCEVYATEHRKKVSGHPGVQIIRGGIGTVDRDLIDRIKPDAIFHMARPKFPRFRRAGRWMAGSVAERLNKRLISEVEKSQHPTGLAFASGSLMYGQSGSSPDETAMINPSSFARQYFRGEVPVLKALSQASIPVTVFRFPWLLGRGSWFKWFYQDTMARSRAVPLFGKGDNLMDVIDIRDAVRLAVKFVLDYGKTGVCNIVSAGPVSQLEFASVVSEVSGLPVKDYREVFPGKPEKEAIRALSTTLVMTTAHLDLVQKMDYTPLKESVRRILSEEGML